MSAVLYLEILVVHPGQEHRRTPGTESNRLGDEMGCIARMGPERLIGNSQSGVHRWSGLRSRIPAPGHARSSSRSLPPRASFPRFERPGLLLRSRVRVTGAAGIGSIVAVGSLRTGRHAFHERAAPDKTDPCPGGGRVEPQRGEPVEGPGDVVADPHVSHFFGNSKLAIKFMQRPTILPPVGDWSFLTNHARALVCIAHDPGIRLRDIAHLLGITERTAFGITNDLAAAGYVVKDKQGRRNRYEIRTDLPLRGAVGGEPTIGEVLDLLIDTDLRSRALLSDDAVRSSS